MWSWLSGLFAGRRKASAVAVAPSGSAWTRAWVQEERSRAHLGATHMGPEVRRAWVQHVLVLEAATGERERIMLDGAGAPSTRYKQLRRLKHQIRFAADGHALVHSSDDGQTWRFVGFEPGLAPYSCAHVSVVGEDPFAAAPTVRELVLEVLASSARPGVSQGRSHVEHPWHDEFDDGATRYQGIRNLGLMEHTFMRELRLAFEYARAHPDDVELRRAAAHALLLPGGQLMGNPHFALDAVAELAQTHADVVEILAPALDDADPNQYRALQILVGIPSASLDARFVARIGRALDDDAPMRIAENTWAVARRVAQGMQSLGPEAHAVLERVASLPVDAHASAQTAVRLAIVTLARVGAADALERIAEGPLCIYSTSDRRVLNDRNPLVPTASDWSYEIGELGSELFPEQTVYSTAACWARVGLSRTPARAPASPAR